MTYENHPVPSSSESNEHATPKWIIRRIARTLPTDGELFDCDPASGAEDTPHAHRTITKDEDGLTSVWNGFVWCNPPWSSEHNDGRMKSTWLAKARRESHRDDVDAVFVVLPDDVSTEWFRDYGTYADYVTFLGRIQYVGMDRNPPFGSMILTFGDIPAETKRTISRMGPTYERPIDETNTTQKTL